MTVRRVPALLLLALPLLAACVNDAASFQIDGRDHSLTVIREQRWLWDKNVELAVVAARLPECQRRHALDQAPAKEASVEVWQTGSTTFILKQAEKFYLVETLACEGFRKLDAAPPGGLGRKLGVFAEQGGKLRFLPEPGVGAPLAAGK